MFMKMSEEKNFITPSCLKHPKSIEIKRCLKFLFSHFFAVPQKGFMKAGRSSLNFFEATKSTVKIRNLSHFSSSLGIGTRVKTVFFSNSLYMPFPIP